MVDRKKYIDSGTTGSDPRKAEVLPDYVGDTEYISRIINQFILKDETGEVTCRKPVDNRKQYNRQDVLRALTTMQLSYRPRYVPGQKVNINTDSFKSALLGNMAKLSNVTTPKSMNQLDSRTIDFVEMLFGAFLRDKNISDAVKDLILLLQVPIIKTALLDKKLFDDETHPARHVLNNIASLGIGIEDKENTVFKTMLYIVEQLLQSFDQKIDVLNTARMSLERLANIEKDKHNKTEKQTRHLIKVEYTRQLVLKELQYYTMNVSIPKSLRPLILNHWSTLMFHRFINYGNESIEWREAVGILRLMVKSFRPVTSREDWLALRSIYKGIVNSVRSCLSNTTQNKEKVFIATSNLQNYYFQKISESPFNTDNINEDPSDKYNVLDCFNGSQFDDVAVSPLDENAEKSRIYIENMPEILKTSNWFEVFTDYSHPVRRLKLSVILKEQAKLIFVDYMGNKVIDKDVEKFIIELENDQSRLINDHSIFEYALSMVIISLAARNPD